MVHFWSQTHGTSFPPVFPPPLQPLRSSTHLHSLLLTRLPLRLASSPLLPWPCPNSEKPTSPKDGPCSSRSLLTRKRGIAFESKHCLHLIVMLFSDSPAPALNNQYGGGERKKWLTSPLAFSLVAPMSCHKQRPVTNEIMALFIIPPSQRGQ